MATRNILNQRERTAPLRRAAPDAGATADSGAMDHPLITMQQQVGNARVARMLAQREEMPTPEEEEEEAATVQAKHDPAIQREEMPTPEEEEEEAATVQAKHDPAIQRQEEEDPTLQAKPEIGMEGGPVSDALSARIQSQRGSGSPLNEGVRGQMEQSFGTSFEDVRVHSDSESQALSHNISAKAFTTGSDIFFGRGANPGDQSLLAHELTHVVQQRSMGGSGPLTVGPAGDSYEQEADSAATTVTTGGTGGVQRALTAAPVGDSHEQEADAPAANVVGNISGAADKVDEES